MPQARVADMNDVNGPEQWFRSLPILTRSWFGLTLVLTCCANFGVISTYKLLFLWQAIKDNFEVWRFVSPFCYAGPWHFNTLITLYMLLQFSRQYEAGGPFNTGAGGGTADYAFALLFGMTSILLSYPLVLRLFPLRPLFTRTLVFFVLYIWSKRNPMAPAGIWGVPLKGMYMPFAYLALTIAMGGAYFDMLHGMAVGHVYYFLADVVPVSHGKHPIQTPQFLVDFFGVGEYVPPAAPAVERAGGNAWNNAGPGRANPPDDPAANRGARGGHHWGGGGNRLGAN